MSSNNPEPSADDAKVVGEATGSAQAQVGRLSRPVQVVVGSFLILAGVAMLVLPGQGILTVLFGLDMVAPDNPLSRWIRKVTPGLDEDTPIPIKWIVIGTAMTVAAIVVAIFWSDDIINWIRN